MVAAKEDTTRLAGELEVHALLSPVREYHDSVAEGLAAALCARELPQQRRRALVPMANHLRTRWLPCAASDSRSAQCRHLPICRTMDAMLQSTCRLQEVSLRTTGTVSSPSRAAWRGAGDVLWQTAHRKQAPHCVASLRDRGGALAQLRDLALDVLRDEPQEHCSVMHSVK